MVNKYWLDFVGTNGRGNNGSTPLKIWCLFLIFQSSAIFLGTYFIARMFELRSFHYSLQMENSEQRSNATLQMKITCNFIIS
jgi:hypothetical protein